MMMGFPTGIVMPRQRDQVPTTRVAVYALTQRGLRLALRLKESIANCSLEFSASGKVEVDVFAPRKFEIAGVSCHWHGESFQAALAEGFSSYAAHVCIMALGIVVRTVAPLLRHKSVDPAVVVLDESGRFAISTVSGHLGGANTLATDIGQMIGAVPVITTASDSLSRLTPDVWARLEGWRLENPEGLVSVNAAIVNDESVYLYVDPPLMEQLGVARSGLVARRGLMVDFAGVYSSSWLPIRLPAVFVTSRIVEQAPDDRTVILRPNNLVVGIGCIRGVTGDRILDAIRSVFDEYHLSLGAIQWIASVDLKHDEEGIHRAAATLEAQTVFVDREDIRNSGLQYHFSAFVEKTIGVGGVCEPAAMMVAHTQKLLVSRQIRQGVTVAVAERSLATEKAI